MKLSAFIFILLFSSSGFLPTMLSFVMPFHLSVSSPEEKYFESDLLPHDCPLSEESSESEDSNESSESDYLKELFADFLRVQFKPIPSLPYFAFANQLPTPAFLEKLNPPPES